MIFFNPDALWLFLTMPFVIVLLGIEYNSGRRALQQVTPSANVAQLFPVFASKWFLSAFFFVIAIVAIILALADPAWGEEFIEEQRAGLDIMIVLDVSRSMESDDIKPSRLIRAKEILRSMVSQISEGRIGLIIARGSASVVVPLTQDRQTLDRALALVDINSISAPGTGLTTGLALAIQSFSEGQAQNRFIVLASDGGDHDPNLAQIGLKSSQAGIPIFSLGMGKPEGALVPGLDPPHRSVLNSQQLIELATISRGVWLDIDQAMNYRKVSDSLLSLRKQLAEQGYRIQDIHQSNTFVSLALLCLGLSFLVRLIRWRKLW